MMKHLVYSNPLHQEDCDEDKGHVHDHKHLHNKTLMERIGDDFMKYQCKK